MRKLTCIGLTLSVISMVLVTLSFYSESIIISAIGVACCFASICDNNDKNNLK